MAGWATIRFWRRRFRNRGFWLRSGVAERVIGDHDRNTLRLRLDPEGEPAGLEPGMTVWIEN
jgi:hypothetical protein